MPYPKPFCWFTKDCDASAVAHREKMVIAANELFDRKPLLLQQEDPAKDKVPMAVCVDQADAFELHSGLDVISQIVFRISDAARCWVDRAVVGNDLACASPETLR